MLTLASASPRRQALLRLTGWEVISQPGQVDEQPGPVEPPEILTRRLAEAKARQAGGEWVVGADTVVVLDDAMLGKPTDRDQARGMLAALRGRSHRVVSSIALLDATGQLVALDTCTSEVPMREYADPEVEAYLESGSPLDKAGAYGIQDGDFNPVDMSRMRDCFANVMGLPLCHLVRNLRRLGHEPPADVPTACQAYTGYHCPVYPAILQGEL